MIFLENVIYIFFVINNILWFFSVSDVDLRVVFKSKTGEVPVIFSVIDVDLRVVGCMVVVMSQELGQWHFL